MPAADDDRVTRRDGEGKFPRQADMIAGDAFDAVCPHVPRRCLDDHDPVESREVATLPGNHRYELCPNPTRRTRRTREELSARRQRVFAVVKMEGIYEVVRPAVVLLDEEENGTRVVRPIREDDVADVQEWIVAEYRADATQVVLHHG